MTSDWEIESMSNQNSGQPDLDWSQIRETVMMLNLAVAQIGRAMNDGDESINTLTDSFTSMTGKTAMIAEAGNQLADGELKDAILQNCQSVSEQMQTAIVAFQFYDMLSQRLNHVGNSLNSLADLVGDPARLFNPFEWRGLQEKIRAKYPNEQDKKMFDAVLNGASIEEALNIKSDVNDPDDIELF